MKKVLIIGAGFLQSFIIKKAKAMGYYTLAVDGNSNAIGFAYADEYEVIDIVDKEACLKFATLNKVDGVLTAATDYGVLTASYIAQKMGLPGLNYESAKTVKNKYDVRKCFLENGVDNSDEQVYKVENIDNFNKELHYPVIVKPCDGSGSRGTRRVDCKKNLRSACLLAINASQTSSAVIETFVSGEEYGAESLVVNNEVYVLAIMKKLMTKPPFYAELGHTTPCGLPADTENKAKQCVEKAIKALGINSGAVNADLLITKQGDVHIVDIGARMGGNMIGPCIVPYGTGIDYMGAIIKTALGEAVDFSSGVKCCVATRLLAFGGGVVTRVPDFEKLAKEFDVEIYQHINVGDVVHEYQTNLDGMGYIVAKAATAEIAEQKSEKALNYIKNYIFN